MAGSNAPRYRRHRALLLAEQGGLCHYCSVPLTLETATREHIVPRSRGGPDAMVNIVVVCAPCNVKRGAGPSPCRCGKCADVINRHLLDVLGCS